MATNPIKTLFGDTEDDLLRQMRMEDQERVNQARVLDKQSGGNYYSGLIADAAQQQANVFSNLLPKGVRAVGGLLGQEDAAGRLAAGMEDPRLGKARQRKADLDMLSKRYETLGSDADGFTDKDAKVIVDDLISLGYLDEPKKMAEIWQGRRLADAKKADAAKEGDVKWGTTRTIVDNDPTSPTYGQKFFTVQRRVGSSVETVTTPVGGGDGEFQGDLKKAEIISTQYGETAVETLQRRINRMEARSGLKKGEIGYKGKVDRNTAQYKEKLKRKTNELQKDLNVDEHKAKTMAEAQLATREENLQKGISARMALPQIRNLLKLAETRASGGDISAAWKTLKRAFGYENRGDAEFRTGSQMLMIENLKKIFGPRATDKDMEELKKAFAREGQPTAANIAILRKWVDKTRTAQDIGDYFAHNPDATTATYSKWIKERYETIPARIKQDFPNATLEGGRIYIMKDGHKLEIKRPL